MPSPEPGADRPAGAGPGAAARLRTPYLQLSGGAVASKVLGAAREILLARFFGTGAVADAYRSGLTLTLSPPTS
ncbi:MAG: hypothetical protein V1774_03365 [Candidatus Eisenbacteria bacterium]